MKSVSSATSDTGLGFRVSRMIRLPIMPITLDDSFASEARTVVFIGRKQKKDRWNRYEATMPQEKAGGIRRGLIRRGDGRERVHNAGSTADVNQL